MQAKTEREADEWSIQTVTRRTGVTSRTIRHYGDIGLLPPSRVGTGGLRYFDGPALVRLQRILLLRELGLSLADIGQVLSSQLDEQEALASHLAQLEAERDRLEARIGALSATLNRLKKGEEPMADDMFEGFDHTQYKDEVIERWGQDAYAKSDSWYRSLTDAEKQGFKDEAKAIAEGFGAAHTEGLTADSAEVQALTARHYAWVRAGWGGKSPSADQYIGLGEMYVADPRFRKHYDAHGEGTAELVRDAVAIYAASL